MIPPMLTAFTPLTLIETRGIHTPVRSPLQALANGGAFFDESLLTASPITSSSLLMYLTPT